MHSSTHDDFKGLSRSERLMFQLGVGTVFNVDRILLRIYSLLSISERPLRVAEICEILGTSLRNTSDAIHELQACRLIKQQTYSCGRLIKYRADTFEIC